MGTDYKKAFEILKQNPVDNEWHKKAEFEAIMKSRKLEFDHTIEGDAVDRYELWKNKNFGIIVHHDAFTNEYQIL